MTMTLPVPAVSPPSLRPRVPPPGRLLAAAAGDLGEHLDLLGPLPWASGGDLVRLVAASGLRGRGGASFPTAVKIEAVARGERPVVIANGAEGEPGSRKDHHLMLTSPHLVLDGLQLVASAVGAREAWCYVAPGPASDALRAALSERRGARVDRLEVELLDAVGGFVSGQETAVVAAVEGKAPLPRDAARRITEKGVRGRPTLVQNVETLTHLAMIARFGPAWFRGVGTDEAPGTFLATVAGPGGAQHVREFAHGSTPRQMLASVLDQRAVETTRAVLVGGYHGSWHSLPEALDTPLTARDVGAGVVLPLPANECGLAATARITGWLASESARQCGPCRFGLPSLSAELELLARGRAHDLVRLHQAAGLVVGRGACHHPDGTARLVRSALETFARDADAHLHGACVMSPAVAS